MAQSQDTSSIYLFYSQDSLQFRRWGDSKKSRETPSPAPKSFPQIKNCCPRLIVGNETTLQIPWIYVIYLALRTTGNYQQACLSN